MTNNVANLVPAHNLKTVAFPDCAKRCRLIDALGAGECEIACPYKFDTTGSPVDSDLLRRHQRAVEEIEDILSNIASEEEVYHNKEERG